MKKSSLLLINAMLVLLFLLGSIAFAVIFPGVDIKWFLLAVVTVLTFTILAGVNNNLWSRTSFWGVMIGLCCAHLAGYVTLLSRVEKWPGPLFVGVFIAELIILNPLIAFLFPAPFRNKKESNNR